MRVIHINSETSWRGGEQQLLYLAAGLKSCGIEQIVAARPASPLAARLKSADIPLLPVTPAYGWDLKTVRILRGVVNDWQPDLIHAHTGHGHTLGWLTARQTGTPLVVSRRVDFRRGRNLFSRWKFLSPAISRYITVSAAIRDILVADGVNRERITVVHSGIDPERFADTKPDHAWLKQAGVPTAGILLGNVAALAPHKDQATLIRAMRVVALARPDVNLVIVGEGHLRKRLTRLVQSLGLTRRVFLPGFSDNVGGVMKLFDIFVMSSRTEGLGTAILDALALSLPVVATNTGGIPEIITDGGEGLLVPPGDPIQLADRILQLAGNPVTRKHFTDRARQRALEFDKKIMVERTRAVYDEITTGKLG
ncbi:MAG: glycosyltransferase [Candidatus Delongbacteria bacterium]|nr:glycosyltransferase [bacterium]MBL7033604.1 glycosyltransferase [Candidatus Delongbacteria bacterium]